MFTVIGKVRGDDTYARASHVTFFNISKRPAPNLTFTVTEDLPEEPALSLNKTQLPKFVPPP